MRMIIILLHACSLVRSRPDSCHDLSSHLPTKQVVQILLNKRATIAVGCVTSQVPQVPHDIVRAQQRTIGKWSDMSPGVYQTKTKAAKSIPSHPSFC
ncbi:hypothetical protein HOY80DRAFT_973475 [Tuber brumale]|nr:hypothetical protein HOY80DRAFT_973475 [Tuber brumale]